MMPGLAAVTLAATVAPSPITVAGNVVLPDEAYRALIDAAGYAWELGTTPADAELLARHVEGFLHDAGYEIAAVEGSIVDGHIHLLIDEGRLRRIVFLGNGDFRTVQLKLAVSIPQQVFNRPAIERQLDAMREDLGITDIRVELVPTEATEHSGPQLEDFGHIAGMPIISPTGRFELHITLGQRQWDTGVGVEIDVKPPDGIRLGASYSDSSLFFEDDRWRGRANLGVNQFADPETLASFIEVSRAAAEWLWATPPLLGLDLRPSALTYLDYRARERPDLDIAICRWTQVGSLASIGVDLGSSLHARFGAGFEARWIFDIQQPARPSTDRRVRDSHEVVGLFNLNTALVFDPSNVRMDRRHTLDLDARLLAGADHIPRWILRGEYQKFFAFGWHDLVVRTRALGEWGYIRFVDEEALGWFLRGAFGSSRWVRRGLGGTGEFRFSLTRDVLKAGAFVDVALFEEPGRRRTDTRLMFAAVVGPGLHFLLFDAFQLDLSYSFGLDTDAVFEHGFSMNARKAF